MRSRKVNGFVSPTPLHGEREWIQCGHCQITLATCVQPQNTEADNHDMQAKTPLYVLLVLPHTFCQFVQHGFTCKWWGKMQHMHSSTFYKIVTYCVESGQ